MSIRILVCYFLILASSHLNAQNNDEPLNRSALVIGNSSYKQAPLKNPENDAKAMAQTLRELGFEVLEYTNANKFVMKQALRDYSEVLQKRPGVGLFYYAGHGIQAEGVNYLVPIGSNIEDQFEIEFECIKADRALAVMEYSSNPFNIVILDACRNNPFRSFSRSAEKGFVSPRNPPTGSIVAFATQPGKTASDGIGDNGLYTQELIKAMKTPGIPIEEVFKKVRINVSKISDKSQIPQEWSSLMGDFYFIEESKEDVVNDPTENLNEPSSLTIKDKDSNVIFGEANRVSGEVELITLMSGVLYLDGNPLNNGNVVDIGLKIPLSIPVGDHLLEMKGEKGVWSEQFLMMPNKKISFTAMLIKEAALNEESKETALIVTPKENEFDYEKVYSEVEVEEKASPVNGLIKFYSQLSRSIEYPSEAHRNKIQGRVYIEFVVDLDGSIGLVKVSRGFQKDCDAEAIRVVRNAKNWLPAKIDGRPVKQKVFIPVSFKLD